MKSYPWYCVLTGEEPLQQGDFIDYCPIIIPTMDLGLKEIETMVRE